eukprot:9801837-Alexandrium_andersonii.AAC.1
MISTEATFPHGALGKRCKRQGAVACIRSHRNVHPPCSRDTTGSTSQLMCLARHNKQTSCNQRSHTEPRATHARQ